MPFPEVAQRLRQGARLGKSRKLISRFSVCFGRGASPSISPDVSAVLREPLGKGSAQLNAQMYRYSVGHCQATVGSMDFDEAHAMIRRIRTRFWAEAAVFALAATAAVAAALVPDWVELVFGVDPDQGSGLLEWTLAILVVIAVIFALMARADWRRNRALQTAAGTEA